MHKSFTLAEVFHLAEQSRKIAFTLSEVLITLGIIGIVAAMTMPTLIQNHKKQETVTKLKYAYSVIGQALASAQAEHGDPANWGVISVNGAEQSTIDREEFLTNFAKTYVMPYLKSVQDYGYVNLRSKYGYLGDYRDSYAFVLPSNILVEVSIVSGCDSAGYTETGGCVGKKIYGNTLFRIDINGFKKPNKSGRDIFLSTFNANGKFQMFQYSSTTKRNQIFNACKADGQICGYLIQMDGWQIKDDYPFRL